MACPIGKPRVNSSDPRVNYNLAPGDTLLTCPYNLAHAVLPIKFPRHVLNCHRMHCESQKKKGEKPLFSICQYDKSHHVRNAELAFHELNCESRRDFETSSDPFGAGSSNEFAEANVKEESEGVKVVLQKPPEVDKSIVDSMFEEENWEDAPVYAEKFDPDKKIMELRKQGLPIIQAHKVVGLSRSEKREFYAKDAEVLKECEKSAFLHRLKDQCTVGRGHNSMTSSASGTSSTIFGDDERASMMTLRDASDRDADFDDEDYYPE